MLFYFNINIFNYFLNKINFKIDFIQLILDKFLNIEKNKIYFKICLKWLLGFSGVDHQSCLEYLFFTKINKNDIFY